MRNKKDSLGLAIEAAHETEVVGSPEAEALQEAICNAVRAYSDFLERHGLIWEDGDPDGPAPHPSSEQALLKSIATETTKNG